VVAHVLSRVQERDERWLSLAIDQLGVSRPALQRFLVHGNSVLLANLTFITKEIFLYHSKHGDWLSFAGMSLRTLEETSRFNPQGTLPELQSAFCYLWNRLVLTARNSHTRSTTVRMLKRIRKIFIALHEGVDDTPAAFSTSINDDDPILNRESSYPLCNAHNHTSTLTPLDMASPLPESAAHATEDITDTTPTLLALTQASQSAHLTFATATISHSPPATAAPIGGASVLPHE
jgi:hypothetical protein